MTRFTLIRSSFALVLLAGFAAVPTQAYIEAPHSFGEVVNKSTNIVVITVTAVDKEKKTVVYRKVQDLKGKHPTDVVKTLCQGELRPGEIAEVFRWAEPGKVAVMFYNGGQAEICMGTGWYQVNAAGEWWSMTHGEPFLLRSFSGRIPKLITLVNEIQTGKEVIVPCLRDTNNKDDLHLRRAKGQKLKASLKLLTYDQTRDFAGYGGAEDISPVRGMPAFSQSVGFGKLDGRALQADAIDFDGDGRVDVCLVAQNKVAIYRNEGDSYSDVMLPNNPRGIRAACWGDMDGDGKPDLLVASVEGVRLYTNQGTTFRDDSSLIPELPPTVTGVSIIDLDRDGKPDIVYADGFSGLRVLMNRRPDALVKLGEPKLGAWRVIGPFPNGGQGFQSAFGPEQDADPTKTFEGKNKAKIAWKQHPFVDAQVNNLKIFPNVGDDATCYVAREIESPTPAELPISLGSDDALKVWLNGEIVTAEDEARACTPDSYKGVLKLKAGKNILLMKIVQGSGDWAFYFRADKADLKQARWFKEEGDYGLAALTSSPIVSLTPADLNGDGRPDLISAMAVSFQPWLSTADGKYVAGKPLPLTPTDAIPVFGDLNGDGLADLFVPSKAGKHRVLFNQNGQFVDAPADPALAALKCEAAGGFIGDLNGDGKADLIVGVWKGHDRILFGDGTGKFTDATGESGMNQKVFNSSAFALGDLNNDGVPDLVMSNDALESLALFAAPSTKALPSLRVEGAFGRSLPNTSITLKAPSGNVVARCLAGGSMSVPVGKYQLQWAGPKGEPMSKPVEVKDQLTRVSLAEEAKK